jgi:hypothetical protein
MKKLGALLIAMLAAAACETGDGLRPLPKPDDPPTQLSDVPECGAISSELVGHAASIYRARDNPQIYILIVDDHPACATDDGGVNDSGVVPVETAVEASKCPICEDGQPMPANTFPGLQQ